jgi:hypothetical protein
LIALSVPTTSFETLSDDLIALLASRAGQDA